MSDCTEYIELMSLLAAGELKPHIAEEVLAHIEHCETCRHEYQIALKIEAVFKENEVEEPLPGFARSVALKISDIANYRHAPEYSKADLWWFVPIAGGLTLILSLIFHLYKPAISSVPYTSWVPQILTSPVAWLVALFFFAGAMVTGSSIVMYGIYSRKQK